MTRKVSKSNRPNKNNPGKRAEEKVLHALEELRPQILRGGEKRDLILDAALELMETYGFKKTTVDEIAERAGVAKGTVYLYFKNKRDIFLNLVYGKISATFEGIRERMKEQPDAPGKLTSLIRAAFEYHAADETMNRVLARDVDFLGPILFREFLKVETVIVEFISGMLEQGIREGSVRADLDTRMAALTVVRFNQVNIARIKTGEAVDIEKYLDTFEKIIVSGIRSKEE